MLTVKRDIESPPGGWKLTVEQTGVTITAPFFTILKNRVTAHMKANSIEIPVDFDEWCADAACRESGLGRPFCGGAVVQPDASMPALTFALAARFLNTMIGVIRDRKFVSREEAERRAAICLACPLHRDSIGGCASCSALLRKVERSMKAYPLDARLGWCGACGCRLSVKCFLENSTLNRAETEKPPYHESCWRNDGHPLISSSNSSNS
jgi:hypothetical protein